MTMSLKLYRLLGHKGLPRNQTPTPPKSKAPELPKTRGPQPPAPFGLSYRVEDGGAVFIQPRASVPA